MAKKRYKRKARPCFLEQGHAQKKLKPFIFGTWFIIFISFWGEFDFWHDDFISFAIE
jgi:hypothetical protein